MAAEQNEYKRIVLDAVEALEGGFVKELRVEELEERQVLTGSLTENGLVRHFTGQK